jgi:hypothetical protein
MTNYEVELADFFTRPNRHWCKGYLWSTIEMEIKDNPSNPKLKDWSAIICHLTKTVCVVGASCRRGKAFTHYENFGIFGMGIATEDERTDGTGIPAGPVTGWPAIGPNGRGKGEFNKLINLGCCSDGCNQDFSGGFVDNTQCHSMYGTVNPDDLPDPLVAYYGINPDSPAYFPMNKVGAHVYLEMLRLFGPNGTRAKPQFTPCCKDGEIPKSGGGSNG